MQGISLRQVVTKQDNNLNLIKLFASILVMVGHAYAFGGGYARYDWLYVLTGGHGDLGGFAVNIFFFYSGLLITQSWFKKRDSLGFWKRRIVRIYPAFLLVTLAIVFLAAPFFSTLPLSEYYGNGETYRYLKNLLLLTEHDLPGVFVGNVYGTAVNGPIWTIRVEMFCYVLCFLYGKLGLLKKEKTGLSVVLYLAVMAVFGYAAYRGVEGSIAVWMPVTMFYIGMLYAVYADAIPLEKTKALMACFGMAAGILLHQVDLVCAVFLPYLLCYLAFGMRNYSDRLRCCNRLGMCSYEIYLWGGFVGQAVTFMCGGSMNEYGNMLLTIPITIILGCVTHRIWES